MRLCRKFFIDKFLLSEKEKNYIMEVYACYNKNEETRRKSSSGGVFALLAEKMLDDHGVVFAVKTVLK